MAGAREHRGIYTIEAILPILSREPKLGVEPLGSGMWTASDGVVRTLFLEGRGSVIAFDTFGTPGAARAYRQAIAATVPGKPVKTIIYTHDHLDHTGFAADFAPQAEIIADEMCARVIGLRQADGQLPPRRVLKGARNRVEIDGVAFDLLNPGPVHGTGNLAAYFPERKVLFFSDTVLPNARYGLLPDYHVANFTRFLRGLLALDFTVFVPGRYPVMDRGQFERGCDYIGALQEATQQAFVEGVPVWIYDAITVYVKGHLGARFGDLDGFDQHVGLTAFRIVHHYLMGGWSLEDTPTPDLNLT
jgi:glyoxylase-like metal-dependent hydrolase (beta-lactamase superfamily II)